MQPGSSMPSGVHIVLVTVPSGQDAGVQIGARVAETLVTEGLAACVNCLPSITSTYLWEGKLNCDSEELLIIKTASRNLVRLEERIRELHPYDLPEIIGWEVGHGSQEYLAWVRGAKSDVPGGE